jgi:DNA-binding transcriptional MerR regulator
MRRIQDIEARAQAIRRLRRRKWTIYQRLSLETLEELVKSPDLDGALRADLEAFLKLHRRHVKAKLEWQEKRGEYRKDMAGPLAIAIGAAAAAFLALGLVPKDYATAYNVVAQGLAAAAWYFIRKSGMRLIETARYQLAMLGKID